MNLIKIIFLTNNISESINHILNNYFKRRFPTFKIWISSIVEEGEKAN